MIQTLQLGQFGRRILGASGGGGSGSYLDLLATQPRAVLSLRKLISTATLAIRVRRSSDNTEQDIGFSGDSLDTAALSSFVGANSAYVVKVYDQTGNGEHLEQATTTKQPRIVNAGAYDGAIIFDGSAHGMAITTLTLGSAYVGTYMKMALPGTYTNEKFVYELSTDFNATGGGTFAFNYNPTFGKWTAQSKAGGSARVNGYSAWSVTSLTQVSLLFDTTLTNDDEMHLYKGGVFQTASQDIYSNQSGNYRSDQNLFVGARNNSAGFARLDLETLVIYNADTSSIRASIEAIVA